MIVKFIRINQYQVGLRFQNDKLVEALTPGWYLEKGIVGERIEVLSEKKILLMHPELDEIIRTHFLDEYLEFIDLKDNERALLWIDGRFEEILASGKHAIWKRFREVKIEKISIEDPQFKHKFLYKITQNPKSETSLTTLLVEENEICLYFCDGSLVNEIGPGFYAFWKNVGTLKFHRIDLREKLLEMSGQDIITSDKVTLRLNTIISYRIIDAKKSISVSEAPDQALYREGQLILRSAIGNRKLDDILNDKDAVANEIMEILKTKADKYGLSIVYCGIRDIILPGDIRELMNRVVAAQKEAEANQIVRREETAATRSQCNTAKMLEQNPTLMRLRELEVLERIAEKSKLNLFLGEKGLTEKVVNML
ncbi:MAG: slipin family protein [Candidatus Riflebacteria bacterium]|nr:slipin family protein [Candidatus Riflebacteria bacterium]